jgi:hypothetical protein
MKLSALKLYSIKILFLHKFENQILQKYAYKGKSKVALVFRHYTMKAYSGDGHKGTHNLYLGIWWSDLTALPDFNSRERAPRTQWMRDWMSSRASLDVVSKKYIYSSAVNWISIIQPKASHKLNENFVNYVEFSLHGDWVPKFIIFVLKAKKDNSASIYCWIPWRIN